MFASRPLKQEIRKSLTENGRGGGEWIGIVVPAYNASRFLDQTLRSIADQFYERWNCVVVDDGSTDNTAAVALTYANQDDRFRVITQENAGVAVARNVGLAALAPSITFVTCMDADDLYRPAALGTLLDSLAGHPEAIAAHGLADFIDENGKPLYHGEFAALGRNRLTCVGGRISLLPTDNPTSFASVVTASTMFPPGLLLTRRKVLDHIGGYDPAVVGAEDWDLLIRLCRRGIIHFLDEVLIDYRRHADNRGAGFGVPEMCRRVYHKAFFSTENTPEHRAAMKASWKAKQRFLLRERLREAVLAAKRGRVDVAANAIARIPFIAYRFARGYPTLGWL